MSDRIIQFIERQAVRSEKNDELSLKATREEKKRLASQFFYNWLVEHMAALEYLFQDYEGDLRFLDFIGKQVAKSDHPIVAYFSGVIDFISPAYKPIRYFKPDVESVLDRYFDEDKIIEVLTLMLSSDYDLGDPPHPDELLFHLWVIFVYYCLPYDDKLLMTDVKIDLAFTKLGHNLSARAASYRLFADDLYRLRKTRKATAQSRQNRQEVVRKHYEQMDTKGRRPYAIAKLIHQEMTKKMLEVPSVRTIRRDLKALGLC